MKVTKLVQVEFSSSLWPFPTEQRKVVWVDSSWNLHVGNEVRFEGSDTIWKVEKIYETKIEAHEINRKWGLDLPKSQRTEA